MQFYKLTPEETLSELKTNLNGLTREEARSRQKRYGPNAIQVKSTPLWKKIVEPFIDVFVLVLAVAAVISVWHGDTLDAIIILIIIDLAGSIIYIMYISKCWVRHISIFIKI